MGIPPRVTKLVALFKAHWRAASLLDPEAVTNTLPDLMTKNQTLSEFVSLKRVKEVEQHLAEMEGRFLSVCRWIERNRSRSEQSAVVLNLLSSSAQYLRIASDNLEGHISVVALAARSLYELNVRTRAILASHDQMQNWQSEALTDKIQTLEGLMALDTAHDMNTERAVLRAEIDRLNGLREKYKLPIVKKPADAGAIAREVGLASEHKALFKLFSKLVHPSSYLTNDYRNAASKEVRAILQIHAQLYAGDTFSRICDVQSVPQEIREANIGIAGGA